VVLHVYDLSMGVAKAMSSALVGRQVDGIWHTGVVVYELEYFYGGGIQHMPPQQVSQNFGLSPVEVVDLGETEIEQSAFHDFLQGIQGKYTSETYDLFHNNCNNFSHEVVKFLTGGDGIPSHIVDLPSDILQTPFGQTIAPMINQMQTRMQENMIPFSIPITSNSNTDSGATTSAPVAPVASQANHDNSSISDSQGKQIGLFKLTLKVFSGALETIELVFDGSDPSIEELKKVVQERTGYAPADQRIIFGGKLLSGGTVSSFGLKSGQAIHMTPRHGAARNTPNTSSLQSSDAGDSGASSATASNSLDLDSCLNMVRQAPEKERKIALKTLLKILENVINNPHEEKYRKINRSNSAFSKRMDGVPGAVNVLKAIGFVEAKQNVGDGETVFLTLEATASGWEKLTAGKTKIKQALNSVTGSNNTNAAPNPFNPLAAGMPGIGNLGGFNAQNFPNMMNDPTMMQNMMNNPMVQEMQRQMASDPQFMQNVMEQARNMGLPGMDTQSMQQMMQSPMFQQMQQQMMSNPQLMQQMMANMSNMGMGNNSTMPDFSALIPNRNSGSNNTPNSNNNNNNSGNNSGNNNGSSSGGDGQMTEEEMIQEAIRRSLQEQ